MNAQTDTLNRNYKLIQSKKVTEINSEVNVYEHIKTGARLMHIKNDDINKVFSISFKTPPEDSTGCPHILEHSVLNGSKNFPAKNTFTELMKGSMKTFLNAFTSSDKTSYPIASTNDQDFYNLMNVYLDAVLYPKIYESADVLKQEGWHHELLRPEDEIVYRGVVYNEMKGAFSTPETILFRKNEQTQFPDTPYGFESGGDPEVIPELTWERFKAFHTKYYHPSNSWIFLYGKLDINKALAFIDEKYLSSFEQSVPDSNIPLQEAFKQPVKVEEFYSIAEEDSPEGKNYLALNFTCSNLLDIETTSAMTTLQEALMDSPASPLKQAIQKSNLCADSFSYYDDSCLQPTFSIICKHVKDENIEPLKNLIFAELERISKDGLDKKLIEATINKQEFILREAERGNFPKGLFYNLTVLKSWLHNGDPFSYLEFEPILAHLRKGLTGSMYEQLMQQYLLRNNHASQIVLKPVKGLVQHKDEEAAKKLAAYKAALDEKQIAELIEDNLRLQQWQSTPDLPEDIAKIPFIELSDIKKDNEKLPLEVEKHEGITLLKHDVFTNGIVYLSAIFELNHMPEKDLPWVSLLSHLMGNLDTENYTFADLSNEIDINTGGISSNLVLHQNTNDIHLPLPKFVLRSKAVSAKAEKMLELTAEYAFKTTFKDTDRLHQLIREAKSRVQMLIIGGGHLMAIRRMLAQTHQLFLWQDMTEGMSYYRFLDEVDKKIDANPQEIIDKLTDTAKSIYTQNNLILSITSPNEDINQVWQKINILTDQIDKREVKPVNIEFTPVQKKEGIIAPVNVQYCAQGGNFKQLGFEYSGKMMVLANILRNDFLMQELRVKGGAYGIMVLFARFGFTYFCSYRDPNLVETYETYGKIADYLKHFDCADRDFEKYIIGTMAELDMPMTPFQKGYHASNNFIAGITEVDRQKLRDEVLSTTKEDIRGFAEMIDAVVKQQQIAAFGVESKLKKHSHLFEVMTPAIPV